MLDLKMQKGAQNKEPYPTCTNIRYDRTNHQLYIDLNDLNRTNCAGSLKVLLAGSLIHKNSFNNFRDIPTGYKFNYEIKKENEIVEASLTLGNKTAICKIQINQDNLRDPLSWKDWEKGP